MKKAVILHGSFDPAHLRHLAYARQISRHNGNCVVFMQPQEGENFRQRCRLVELLTKGWKNIRLYKPRTAKKYEIIKRQTVEDDEDINRVWSFLSRRQQAYIMEKGMYCQQLFEPLVSQHRWQHMQQVALLAKDVAAHAGIDPGKAYMAGLCHDVAKHFDSAELKWYMETFYPAYTDVIEPLWHEFAGAVYLSRHFRLRDKDILKAVRHHATGDDEAPLSMLIYSCDKLDPSRGYDSSATVELCRRNLKEGFHEVKRQQKEYLKQEGLI